MYCLGMTRNLIFFKKNPVNPNRNIAPRMKAQRSKVNFGNIAARFKAYKNNDIDHARAKTKYGLLAIFLK
jgi:hypothetical protein